MEEQNKTLNNQKVENEDELFHFVEYSPEAAEMIGYSDYSYWKSVFQNFLKKKSAVILSIIFCKPGNRQFQSIYLAKQRILVRYR